MQQSAIAARNDLEERIDALAYVLRVLRPLVIEVPRRNGDWQPASGSQAELDLALEIFPADVNYGLLHHPRAVCSLYVRTAAEILHGAAALLDARAINLAPAALARPAFENAVRAVLTLDTRIDARTRAVRAVLGDIIAAHFHRLAAKHLGGRGSDAFKQADHILRTLVESAEKNFTLERPDDPFRWTIDGESYPRITEAIRSWAEWRIARGVEGLSPNQAEGFYDYLSLYGHPQSFAAHPEALWGAGVEPRFEADFEIVGKLMLGAHASFIDAAKLLYDYHGWDVPELTEIVEIADAIPLATDNDPSTT
jgi:hypothetical protein